MASDVRSVAADVSFGRAVRTVFGVPFRLQTYRNLCYLVLAVPLGLVYFVLFAVGLSLGVGLAVVVVGIPILLAMLALATGLASVERRLATAFLGVEISMRNESMPDSLREWLYRLVGTFGTWKAVVYLVTKLFIGAAASAIVLSVLVTAVSMLAVPLVYDQPGVYVGVVADAPVSYHPALYVGWDRLLVGLETVVTLSAWRIDTLAEALAVAGVGVVLVVVSLHLLNALAWLSGRYTQVMLGTREPDSMT